MQGRRELKVGVFWFVEGDLVFDAVPLERGRQNGSVVQHGNHVEYWQKFAAITHEQVLLKSHDPLLYPRGRVVFLPAQRRTLVYADACLWSPKVQAQIQEAFGIAYAFRFQADAHYHCSWCGRRYPVHE